MHAKARITSPGRKYGGRHRASKGLCRRFRVRAMFGNRSGQHVPPSTPLRCVLEPRRDCAANCQSFSAHEIEIISCMEASKKCYNKEAQVYKYQDRLLASTFFVAQNSRQSGNHDLLDLSALQCRMRCDWHYAWRGWTACKAGEILLLQIRQPKCAWQPPCSLDVVQRKSVHKDMNTASSLQGIRTPSPHKLEKDSWFSDFSIGDTGVCQYMRQRTTGSRQVR
ncbi:hypothetical protein QBC35DRAFT_12936 [Podospora australis]|uniref:Uncharacterized protein n=1 Tax=Podospora australis TaxID=1536484 RepID=A0AAN6X073_9PEZI|nr:hypothetical protein QBC35DRAFT_12936 [Podospora australis]